MLIFRRKRTTSVTGAIFFLLAVVRTGVVLAGTFQVNPIRITLSQQSSSSLLTVRNDSTERVRFQIGVFEWDQSADGEMLLTPTEDLIFFPNLLAIEPGDERNVRVGTNKSIVSTEKSYRIFVEELPPTEKSETQGIRILTKMGVPIFIQPAKRLLQGQVGQIKLAESRFSFEVKNAGNVHFFPRFIRVQGTGSTGETLFERDLQAWYILSGGIRRYSIDITQSDCPKLQNLAVEVEFEGKTLKENFSVPPSVCQR
jgi:fimbrial chaperone protein